MAPSVTSLIILEEVETRGRRTVRRAGKSVGMEGKRGMSLSIVRKEEQSWVKEMLESVSKVYIYTCSTGHFSTLCLTGLVIPYWDYLVHGKFLEREQPE